MPVAALEFIAPVIALISLGAFTLLGFKMWLGAKAQRQGQVGGDELRRLVDVVEQLESQVQVLRDDMTELHERVDFAERMLARGERRLPGSAGRSPDALDG